MDITIKDGYFEDPDKIRDLALSLDNWMVSDKPNSQTSWRGERCAPLSSYNNPELDRITQDIFDYVWAVRNLSEWRYPQWNVKDPQIASIQNQLPDSGEGLKDPVITAHFHFTPAYVVDAFMDFWTDRFHKDFLSCAGLIYLSPDPEPESGTSILDGPNTKFVNVENVYNRLISYNGYNVHGATGCFGDTRENSRLTLVFFINERKPYYPGKK